MIVIFSHDYNTFYFCEFREITIEDGVMIIQKACEDPLDQHIVQKVINFGFYSSIVIDRFDGEILFEAVPY